MVQDKNWLLIAFVCKSELSAKPCTAAKELPVHRPCHLGIIDGETQVILESRLGHL